MRGDVTPVNDMLSWASKASLLGGGGGGMGMGMGGHNASEVLLHQQLQQQLAVRMPRVVPDQKDKFENDELFRKLSRESEVRFNNNDNDNCRPNTV